MIGLTEQLNATVQMAGRVFHFIETNVDWNETTCVLPHNNISHRNNLCGPENTYWNLPPHPNGDEESRKAIEANNPLDVKLYQAAVLHLELQKCALKGDEEDL